MKKIEILLVDDNSLVRGDQEMLDPLGNVAIVSEASNALQCAN